MESHTQASICHAPFVQPDVPQERRDPNFREVHLAVLLAGIDLSTYLSVECIRSNPAVLDEYAHVPVGVSHWQLGRFSLYRENPPLVRLLTSLPVWLSKPTLDYSRATHGRRSEWQFGLDFMLSNPGRYDILIQRARCVVLLLGTLSATLIFWWVSEEHGGGAAAVCALIWLFDPTYMANATIATIDVGATFFGLLAVYTFWRFLKFPDWRRAVGCGVALGVAQASKFSLLTLYPAFLVLFVIARTRHFSQRRPHLARRPLRWLHLIAIYLLSLLVLNTAYCWEGTGKPLGSFEFRSLLLSAVGSPNADHPPAGNRFRGTWAATLPVPLPLHYVLGFDSQKWDEEIGFVRPAAGRLVRWRDWYSPMETLAYKLPLGTLALLAFCLLYWLIRLRNFRLETLASLIPALILLGTLCSQTGLNWIVRYSLPTVALLSISIGPSVAAGLKHSWIRLAIGACLAWNLVSVASTRPYYLSYGNELIGGMTGAQRRFIGSNYDWGQDLYRLKRWADEHGVGDNLICTFFGAMDSNHVGLRDTDLPESFLRDNPRATRVKTSDKRRETWWAVSSSILNGMTTKVTFENGITTFVVIDSPSLRPESAFQRVGSTIFVFRVVHDSSTSLRSVSYEALAGCLRVATEDELMFFVTP